MNAFEKLKTLLLTNGFKIAKQYYNNTDLCSITTYYMYDFHKHQCKLSFIEFHGSVYSYSIKMFTEKKTLINTFTGFKDIFMIGNVYVTEKKFWNTIINGLKNKNKSKPKCEQIKMNLDEL